MKCSFNTVTWFVFGCWGLNLNDYEVYLWLSKIECKYDCGQNLWCKTYIQVWMNTWRYPIKSSFHYRHYSVSMSDLIVSVYVAGWISLIQTRSYVYFFSFDHISNMNYSWPECIFWHPCTGYVSYSRVKSS